MKTQSPLLILVFIVLFVAIPSLLYSQIFDLKPDNNASIVPYSETSFARRLNVNANDPAITAMVEAINADTIYRTLRQLQNWGSRFMLNDNRKDVATWLMNKFLSYGYTDVKLDSFYNIVNKLGYVDSTWQYNVECTLNGASAPEEIYVIGGHYDSYSDPDPYSDAPGVDDNGSAVAATLEIARVMANLNYHPPATIRFTLFGAEELGVFGSQYAAHKARLEGTDIRYMFSMDMVANNPQNLDEVRATWYPGFEWACYAAAGAIEQYTVLSVSIFSLPFSGGSDSYSYWSEGFTAAACIEPVVSPYMHTPADSLGNYNIPYLAKVTGGALATIVEQQLFSYPQNLVAHSTKVDITLQWKPTNNSFIKGFNIYRSDISGSQYQKISPTPVSDSIYHDLMTEPNKQYYFVLTTVNDSLQESGFSEEVTGARFDFNDTLLVLANTKGSETTPDSIFEFYKSVLDTIPFVWHDVNSTKKVNHSLLSRYRFLLWMSNTADFEVQDKESLQSVSDFMANGGNVLFAGFNPAKFWTDSIKYPLRIKETSLLRQLFKVDSVNLVQPCMMFRANKVVSGYDTLNVDSLKYMTTGYPGQIYNVEIFAPAYGASVIYRFDSKFDSSTILGMMKNRPVGLEYMGNDYKSILLSFPLYYMDAIDVRKFLHYIMTEKFIHPVGIEPIHTTEFLDLHIYPNPVGDAINITFTLSKPGHIKLILMSMQGQLLNTWIDTNLEQGTHWLNCQLGRQSSGIYQVVLQSNEGKAIRKIVRLR